MAEIVATESGTVPAPAPRVYGILADYREGHPSILPPAWFRNLRVLEGGYGAGTRIAFEMRALGATHRITARIDEPEPGRRLVETAEETGGVTEFLVEPIDDGRGSRVTITTRYVRGGLAGWLERRLVPRLLHRVYAEELRLLAERAQE